MSETIRVNIKFTVEVTLPEFPIALLEECALNYGLDLEDTEGRAKALSIAVLDAAAPSIYYSSLDTASGAIAVRGYKAFYDVPEDEDSFEVTEFKEQEID